MIKQAIPNELGSGWFRLKGLGTVKYAKGNLRKYSVQFPNNKEIKFNCSPRIVKIYNFHYARHLCTTTINSSHFIPEKLLIEYRFHYLHIYTTLSVTIPSPHQHPFLGGKS